MIHRPGGLADAGPWAEVVAGASAHLIQDRVPETRERQHEAPGARRSVVEHAGRRVTPPSPEVAVR